VAPAAGQGGSGRTATLYVGSITSFNDLSDAFQRASGPVVSAVADLDAHGSNTGDPFAHASSDTHYAQVLRETLAALDNLQDGLITLAHRVEDSGNVLVAAEGDVARSMTP
jgi:hypothetical protein